MEQKEIKILRNSFLIDRETKEVESGFRVSGYFKRWNTVNFNKEMYDENSYDKFIEDYYVKNQLYVPLNVLHQGDLFHLAGKIIKMEKTKAGLWIEGEISKSAIYYSDIVAMIEDNILQGFSDEGWASEYEYRETENGDFYWYVQDAVLSQISLVSTPAEAEAKMIISNATKFVGFEKKEEGGLDSLFI